MLALDAGAIIFVTTNNALQMKSLVVKFVHPNRSLRRDNWTRDPHRTTKMSPLVKCFRWRYGAGLE